VNTWRGLPAWALKEANVRTEDGSRVVLPYYLLDGRLYAERVVAIDGRRWWRPGDGRPVIPYGLAWLEEPRFRRYRVLLLAEGESDALAAWGALAHHGVDVLGVPGAGTWKPEWRDHLDGYCAAYVAGDGDDAGRALTRRVTHDTGAQPLELADGDDLRALIQRGGGDAVLELMSAADRRADIRSAWDRSETVDDFAAALETIGQAA